MKGSETRGDGDGDGLARSEERRDLYPHPPHHISCPTSVHMVSSSLSMCPKASPWEPHVPSSKLPTSGVSPVACSRPSCFFLEVQGSPVRLGGWAVHMHWDGAGE
jgi:hypothetical protein